MPEHEAAALLGTSHFRVLIGREELGFAEVGPLSSEVDPESGEQFAHVVLRRALSRDTRLFDWRRAIVDGKNDRRTAEVVGKWVWVRFTEQPAAEIRQQLAQLGFHWNSARQAWQHPCGSFSLGSQADPREKYSSYFPADARAA